MLKVSEVVASIVAKSLEASIMLRRGCLNYSAYAKSIHSEVEAIAKKPVKLGSIVIALSRLSRTLKTAPELLPAPNALEVSARSGLMEIVYEKTEKNLELFHLLQKEVAPSRMDFFMATRGIAEITLIAPQARLPTIQQVFRRVRPKFILRNLSALTLHIADQDIYTPNIFFSIFYPFAIKRLNVIEAISTFTEITMIFEDKDLQEAFEVLKGFLKR